MPKVSACAKIEYPRKTLRTNFGSYMCNHEYLTLSGMTLYLVWHVIWYDAVRIQGVTVLSKANAKLGNLKNPSSKQAIASYGDAMAAIPLQIAFCGRQNIFHAQYCKIDTMLHNTVIA